MTNIVMIRRSAVPGKVPTTAQLQAGELGLNTSDKALYFSTGNEVVQVQNKYPPALGGEQTYLDPNGVPWSLDSVQYTYAKKATGVRNFYLSMFGDIASNVLGYIMPANCAICRVLAAIETPIAVPATFEIRLMPTAAALVSVTIPAGQRWSAVACAVDVAAGGELAIYESSTLNVANPYALVATRWR